MDIYSSNDKDSILEIVKNFKTYNYKTHIGFMCKNCFDYAILELTLKAQIEYGIKESNFFEKEYLSVSFYPSFDFLCPNCRDITQYTYPFLDPNITPIISLLNKKGFYTAYCCEGHIYKDGTISHPYIKFINNNTYNMSALLENIPLFGNWKFKPSSEDYYISIPDENHVKDKKKNMIDLLIWAELLPYIDGKRLFTIDYIDNNIKAKVERTRKLYNENLDQLLKEYE